MSEPTLGLEFLDLAYQPRFRFLSSDGQRIGREDVAKIGFSEHTRPTVITDNGSDVLCRGTMWVRSSDGVVMRTILEAMIPSPTNQMVTVSASIAVNYGRNDKLNMWLPSRMDEHYVLSHDVRTPSTGIWAPSSRYESTNCIAKYSNYRRFETSARIVPRTQ